MEIIVSVIAKLLHIGMLSKLDKNNHSDYSKYLISRSNITVNYIILASFRNDMKIIVHTHILYISLIFYFAT